MCSICTEVLYQPLTVLDCLHTFCASCLKEWFTHQRRKAEASRSRSTNDRTYTCPTCRATARDTQRNALVNNLLESFLASNPDRDRSDEDKQEMRGMYAPGENILPKIHRRKEHRTQRNGEAATRDRELLDETRHLSLQDIDVPRPSLISAATLAPPNIETRDRSVSAEREQRRQRRSERERARGDSSVIIGGNLNTQNDRRQRSSSPPITSPRHPSAIEARQREHQMLRQASLRSMVSVSESGTGPNDSFDEARIMQEILAEGFLDGIDVNALTEAEQDMWAERIAEMYHARHARRRTSNPSGQVQQNAAGSVVRDSSGLTLSLSSEERSRPGLGDRQRSDTMPTLGATQNFESILPVEAHSTTHVAITRSISNSSVTISRQQRLSDAGQPFRMDGSQQHSIEQSPSRIRSAADSPTNSSADRTVHARSSLEVDTDSSRGRVLQASSRLSQLSGNTTTQPQARPVMFRERSPRLAQFDLDDTTSPPSAANLSNTPATSITYEEPLVTCFRCRKPNIQYHLHRHCGKCQVDLCMRCFREGRGCKHWFGFGHAADERFSRAKRVLEEPGYPHRLVGRQYTRPPSDSSVDLDLSTTSTSATSRYTTSDPSQRLHEGNFCDRCSSFSNEQFWLCDACNDGEWGFCKHCVDTHRCCVHPLLPVSYNSSRTTTSNPRSSINSNREDSRPSPSQPQSGRSNIPRSATLSMGSPSFHYNNLIINVSCNICHQNIPPSHLRFHCPFHVSPPASADGDFDLCTHCNYQLLVNGRSRVDGPEGWRKCPGGHRMIVLNFEADEDGAMHRVVRHDLIGGWKLTEQDMADFDFFRANSTPGFNRHAGPSEGGTWTWREDAVGTRRGTRARSNSVVHSPALQQARFPPEGGAGGRGVAIYSYWPEDGEGGAGELNLPRGAEVTEIEDINGDWLSGVYAGDIGVFPDGFVRWS